MTESLSHLDDKGHPQMVDVSQKHATVRKATAMACIRFNPDVWAILEKENFTTKKGAIFDVARIAGTMAVKKTSDTIPFCHTLPITGCHFEVSPVSAERSIEIRCEVKTEGKTGVEMEALCGANVAVLALYDMTKSLGSDAIIDSVKLLSKTGGKQDYQAK